MMHDVLGRDGVRRCRKFPRKICLLSSFLIPLSHPRQTDNEGVGGGVVADANITDDHVSAYLPSKLAATLEEGEYYKQVGAAD